MASIFKRTRSNPIPEGAEIIERRRKATAAERRDDPDRKTIVERFAVWTDRKTKRARKAPLNAAGTSIVVEAQHYTIAYFDADGVRQEKNSKAADLKTAQRIADKLESDVAQRRLGLIDCKTERYAKEAQRPILEHVADFEQNLQDRGSTPDHVAQTTRQVKATVSDCKAERIGDLTGAAVMGAIGDRRTNGASLRTCNSYLRAVRSFTRWLWKEKRTPEDSLSGLSQFNEETDRQHIRRELTPEELARLLTHVESNPKENFCLSGPVRAMAYRVALGTGFRVKEMRTLTPASFDLDSSPPTVTVEAAYSKRRRQDVQPIRPDLAHILRPWLADYGRDDQLFRLPHNTSKMFQRDLAAARTAWIEEAQTDNEKERRNASDFLRYQDAAGRVADFHATRHTYISGLVAGGATVKTCQELARHSTPVLTIGRYSHARLHDLTGALDALPDLQPQDKTPETLAATGTDGPDGSNLPAYRQQYSDETTRKPAKPRERYGDCREGGDRPEVLSISTLSENMRDVAEVVRGGVEPPTHGFSVRCSTN